MHAYEEWGDRCVERFNGMWAFALWDGRRERLFCSRDRFGVKPFYYRFDDGRFVFASELKAFRVDSSTTLRAEPRRGARLRRAGRARPHATRRSSRGSASCEPAHSLVFDREGLRTSRYWTLERRELRRATRSARCASCSSTPSGFACAATSRSGPASRAASTRPRSPARSTICSRPRPRTRGRSATGSERSPRTSRTQGFDERPFALEVVRKTNADPHWVSFNDEDIVEYLPAIVDGAGRAVRLDEHRRAVVPDASRARGRAQGDARRAGRRTRSLAGYPTYFSYRFADLLARGRLATLAPRARRVPRLHGVSVPALAEAMLRPLASERMKLHAARAAQGHRAGSRVPRLARNDAPQASTSRRPFPDYLRRRMELILTERGLPELLHYEDRNSMAHSLEAQGAVPRLPAGRALLLAPARAADRPRRDEGRAPAGARRPACRRSCATGSTSSAS